MALVRVRTIPIERPPLVGEVSANSFTDRGKPDIAYIIYEEKLETSRFVK
jgi:hypothetical protein